MKSRTVVALVLLLAALLSPPCGNAQTTAAVDIPEPLAPWETWVRHGHEEMACPTSFDGQGPRRCQWPSRLYLDVSDQGGIFELSVALFAPSRVTLPGNGDHWPVSVVVDGQPIPTTAHRGRPGVWLPAGGYQIRGEFIWDRLPERIAVPPAVGLVVLNIDGRTLPATRQDTDGWLSLHGEHRKTRREDSMRVAVFRLVEDDIPMRVVTRALVQVSGRPREIRLPDLLPAHSTVMAIDSPLPAKIDAAGTLLAQARPGTWDIRVTVRLAGPVGSLPSGKGGYGEEIWSFKAHNGLRMVNVSGAPAVEPSRTRMPEEWQGFPAYLMTPGKTLQIETIRRGDPDPAPDRLILERTWWLDFDGTGFTVHDRINGSLSRTWHLAMAGPMALGRVAVDGRDQLITRQGADNAPGVQLRQGQLAMEADSRLVRKGAVLPAIGWDHDFQQTSGWLNLPPGWTLFSAGGVDIPAGAWLQRWSLLDFFLVLIIAVSTWKVRSPLTAILALITLVLIFHEPGAPRTIWLHLLAVSALLKYLPAGWFRRLVVLWGVGAAIVLAVTALPFIVQQVRGAIYPQLSTGTERFGFLTSALKMEMASDEVAAPAPPMVSKQRERLARVKSAPAAPLERRIDLAPEADALIQTGPGLPQWRWRSVRLQWNGPVDRHQTIRLWLVSPLMNLVLGLARALLLLLLIAGFIDWRSWRNGLPNALAKGSATLMLMLLLFPAPPVDAEGSAGGFPPPALLDELRDRLFEPPRCLPRCAEISRLELAATPDQLRMILEAHGQADSAIPLPVSGRFWQPARVLLNNAPADTLTRDTRGNLWMLLPQGVHEVKLIGSTTGIEEIRFTFPMPPVTGTYAGVGWMAQGFQDEGKVATTVTLTRVKAEGQPVSTVSKTDIPAFFALTRTLHLGLQWEATTRIHRMTAPGTPELLDVPLLEGASLTTPGLTVKNGKVQIAMGPDDTEMDFATILPVLPAIQLTAPADVPWTETWILDAGTMWRCKPHGLVVIHHQDADRNWRPQWEPWPGETVTIDVTRPEAVSGRTITIDSARLALTPGRRFSRTELTLAIRTSKGAQHQLELPENANLERVAINGRSLPVRQDGRLVNLPLEPGTQSVVLNWLQLQGIASRIDGPTVNIGSPAVNATVQFKMPEHRWILFAGGPRLGPAVRFWSYLFVVIAIAIALGRTNLTPLGTVGWILLGLGLAQSLAPVAVLVVGWLLALGLRCHTQPSSRKTVFNAGQILLALLTVAALAGLYGAIEHGLLGNPDMQIAGNGSTRFQLNWTQDRIDGAMPVPWVISLPQWVYHLLMLFWSIWLAFSLISWLRWGWTCFSNPSRWKPIRWRRRKRKAAAPDNGSWSGITACGLRQNASLGSPQQGCRNCMCRSYPRRRGSSIWSGSLALRGNPARPEGQLAPTRSV